MYLFLPLKTKTVFSYPKLDWKSSLNLNKIRFAKVLSLLLTKVTGHFTFKTRLRKIIKLNYI